MNEGITVDESVSSIPTVLRARDLGVASRGTALLELLFETDDGRLFLEAFFERAVKPARSEYVREYLKGLSKDKLAEVKKVYGEKLIDSSMKAPPPTTTQRVVGVAGRLGLGLVAAATGLPVPLNGK
jgi:hypothetical protein